MMRNNTFTALALVLTFWLPQFSFGEEKVVVRAYDVSDLIGDAKSIIAAPALSFEGNMRKSNIGMDAMTNQDFLWQYFEPDLALRIEKTLGLTFENGKALLGIRASTEIQDLVDVALTQARNQCSKRNLQIVFRARLYLMDPRLRQEHFAFPQLDWKVTGGADQPFAMLNSGVEQRHVVQLLSDKQLAPEGQIETMDLAGLSLLPGQAGLSLLPGQKACLTKMNQRAYRPLIFPPDDGAADLAQPLSIGDVFSVRACPSHDRRFIHVQVEHQRSALRELRHIDLGVAGIRDDPVLWFGQESIDCRIPDGGACIIATKVYQDSDRPRAGFVLIGVDIVEFE